MSFKPSSNYLDFWLLWPPLSVSGQSSPSSFPASPKYSLQPQQWEQSSSHSVWWEVHPQWRAAGESCSCCRCLWVRGDRLRGSAAQLVSSLPAPFPDSSQQGCFSQGRLPAATIPSIPAVSLESPSPWTHSPFHTAIPLCLPTAASPQMVKKLPD